MINSTNIQFKSSDFFSTEKVPKSECRNAMTNRLKFARPNRCSLKRLSSVICAASDKTDSSGNEISEHLKNYIHQQISNEKKIEDSNLSIVVAVVGIYAALATQIWTSTNRSSDQYVAVKDLINKEITEVKLNSQKLDHRLDKVDQKLGKIDGLLRRKLILGNFKSFEFPKDLC